MRQFSAFVPIVTWFAHVENRTVFGTVNVISSDTDNLQVLSKYLKREKSQPMLK
jgi:hypothetical protein